VKIAPRYDYLEQERRSTVGYRGPAHFTALFLNTRACSCEQSMSAPSRTANDPMFRDSAKESLSSICSRRRRYDDYEICADRFAHRFREKFSANDPM